MNNLAQVTIELNTLLKVKEFDLFDFDYPTPNQSWKTQFENTFIEHYRFNEIGVETADRFKQRLASRLNLIMPTYVERYNLLEKVSDPLLIEKTVKNYSEDEGRSKSENTNLDSTSSTNSSTDFVTTDYPQHTNIVDDIPTQKDKTTLGGSSTVSDVGSKTVGDSRDLSGQEETVRTGSLKEIEQYLQFKKDIIYQVIQECKTLFLLVY